MKKFFTKKPVVIILSIILAILAVVACCNAYFASVALEEQKGVAVCEPWSECSCTVKKQATENNR